MPWPKPGATFYFEQLGLPDKGRALKGLVVCNSWDLKPYDLLNGLAQVIINHPLRYDSYDIAAMIIMNIINLVCYNILITHTFYFFVENV